MSRIGLFSTGCCCRWPSPARSCSGRRHAPLRVLLAPVLLVTIVSALGWGITRFRHAAEVSIVILAAVALSALYDRLPKRQAPAQVRPASSSAEPHARHGRIRWPSL